MTKVEFINQKVSPKGAKITTRGAFMRIEHKCGCILCIDHTQSPSEWADLCNEHNKQYAEHLQHVKRNYWAVLWDNYMGSGSVKEIELTPDEYKQMKENGCGDTPYWGVYDKWIDAEIALDKRYAD